jgi:hypothetical protein
MTQADPQAAFRFLKMQVLPDSSIETMNEVVYFKNCFALHVIQTQTCQTQT